MEVRNDAAIRGEVPTTMKGLMLAPYTAPFGVKTVVNGMTSTAYSKFPLKTICERDPAQTRRHDRQQRELRVRGLPAPVPPPRNAPKSQCCGRRQGR